MIDTISYLTINVETSIIYETLDNIINGGYYGNCIKLTK